MPSPAKQLSPSELAALEHAFASDPASDAYRPLVEAYLSLSRFMEAMVVCKKGVKAHPDDMNAKVLLARVYAEQGKDKKALDEVEGALGTHPGHPVLNRVAAQLQMKLGQKDLAIAALKRAADAAPNDSETLDLLRKWGIPYKPGTSSRPAASPGPRHGGSQPQIRSASRPDNIASSSQVARPPPMPPSGPPPVPSSDYIDEIELPDVDVSFEDPARPKTAKPAAGRNVAYAEALADRYQTQEYTLSSPIGREKRRRKLGTFKRTAILGVVCGIGLIGYYGWTAARKARDIEIGKMLEQTRGLLEKDTYKSYREAADICDKILEKDPDSVAGHSYLAYVDAIRSGELGDGERFRDEAKKHLEAAKKLTDKHSHMIAADVYLRYFGGDAQGAIDQVTAVLKNEADSAFLNGVLGVMLMQSGDLDGAKVSLDKARRIADRDARINQMLAELYRRRGTGYESQAENSYNSALRYTPDHVPSILGYGMMLLTAERFDDALKVIDKVTAMGENASPRQVAVAYAVKASVLYAKGKASEGASLEQKALGGDSSNPDIYDIIGQRKAREGDLNGAAESLQKAISLDPRREMFYANLTHTLLRKEGGAKQAIEALTGAASRLPDDPRIAKLLGDAYRVFNDFKKSLEWYEKALAFAKAKAGTDQVVLDKGFPQAQLGLGKLYRQMGDTEQAVKYLELAKKEFQKAVGTGAADVDAELGEIELARNPSGEKAESFFKAALEVNPRQCESLWALGKMSFDRKVKDEAKRMLGGYAVECPRGVHVPEAIRLFQSIK